MDGQWFPAGVALVVGGSGGVGAAICQRLAAAGSDIALTYRSNEAAAGEVAESVSAMGRVASVHRLALDEPGELAPLLDELAGALHTVVYAAGSDISQRFISDIEPDEFARVIRADLEGFFELTSATLPHLRASAGSLVAITSSGLARYAARDILSIAPKAGIEALVRGIAREEGRYGVRANAVALGVIDAGMFHRLRGSELDQRWVEAAERNIALRRFGSADEVANAVAFLASRQASYVTGQILQLDGGYSI